MATKRQTQGPGGSRNEQKGTGGRQTPPVPDDSRDFGERHGDTDLDDALEDLEKEAEGFAADGRHDVERTIGGAPATGGHEESGDTADPDDEPSHEPAPSRRR